MDPNSTPLGGVQVNLVVRIERDEDEPFLTQLRNEVDHERLLFDQVQLEEEEKKLLLDIQAEAHRRFFKNVDWDKRHCIIEFNGEPAGAFIVYQDKEEIRLADIVISQKFRGLGVGFAVVQNIMAESAQSERPLRLHVVKDSPALQWYEQMGFRLLEDRVSHMFMEWLPPNLQGKTLYFPGQ